MSDDNYNAVIAALAPFADGATLQEIAQAMKEPPPDRTLSRWLSELVKQDWVVQTGAGRGMRYALSAKARQQLAVPPAAGSAAPKPSPSPRTAGDASDPDFPALLAMAIPTIVTYAMDRQKVDVLLQSHAVRNQKNPAAYLAYAHTALETLTFSAVEPDGLTPDQFANWRKFYPAKSAAN